MNRTPPVRRVLLVEDDASIAQFVAMALEEDPVQLTTARSLREAREHLRRVRFDVVLCDMMLGDGSGLDLLRELAGTSGTARVAFTAALHAPLQARLAEIGVHEVLAKPVSMDALRRAVGLAVDDAGAPTAPTAGPARPGVVDEYFGGDASLYGLYRAQCLEQFERDLEAGDHGAAAGDWAALRHLAHSLKSVLAMLGDDEGSGLARALEGDAARADAGAARPAWKALAGRLQRLRQAG